MGYTRINMKIQDTFLGIEDHGIFTFCLHVSGGGYETGIGNIALAGKGPGREIELLRLILEVVGVTSWEKLKGQGVQVLYPNPEIWGSTPVGIMNLYDENMKVIFREFFKDE